MGKMQVIHNGCVLTMAPEPGGFDKGWVLIQGDRIADLGEGEVPDGLAGEPAIDARGGIIMPGLVNAHTHAPMSMLRGLADDLPLETWLNDYIFPAEARMVNPESVAQWTLQSCKEMLLGGITCCCDGYFLEKEVAQAFAASGIRAVAGQGVMDFPAPGVPDPRENMAHAKAYLKAVESLGPRVLPSLFCHSAYTCSGDTLIRGKTAAKDAGVLFQIHAAEVKAEPGMIKENRENLSVIQYLDGLGVLDEHTLVAHGVWVDEADMEILAQRGTAVVHCPESNMKLASGIAPVPEMLDAGITVALGTDGSASNNDLDLFGEMDTCAKLHKVAKMDPCVMDAKTCVKMATLNGAKALGLEKEIGSIEVGKKADMIVVDTGQPHLHPVNTPWSALVYGAKSSDVSWVMVDGIVRVKDKRLV